MKIARRQFLGGGGYALLASLGYVLPGCAQKEDETATTLADLFDVDFRGYGYDRYLNEVIEKARWGGIQGGGAGQWAACGDEKKLQDFRSAWGIDRRYAVDWRSVSSQPVDKPTGGSGITRVKFDLDCGFPVVALIGKGDEPRKGVVLLLHGMGTTPERTLGLGEADYMRHIGRRLIKQGYTVICPFFPHAGNLKSVAKIGALLAAYGVGFHGLAISIALASLDVAHRLEGAAVGKAYCYGVSIGALTGLHASLLDRRVKALILSGYLRDDRSLIQQGVIEPMIDQGEIYPTIFTPGASRYGLEMAIDIWKPRPLFIEVGLDDKMSGIDQGRDRVLQNIVTAYQTEGKATNFDCHKFRGGHEANGVAAINWLKHLDA
jgi:pimeloyl-ACP methyl ester carboxylesterase